MRQLRSLRDTLFKRIFVITLIARLFFLAKVLEKTPLYEFFLIFDFFFLSIKNLHDDFHKLTAIMLNELSSMMPLDPSLAVIIIVPAATSGTLL